MGQLGKSRSEAGPHPQMLQESSVQQKSKAYGIVMSSSHGLLKLSCLPHVLESSSRGDLSPMSTVLVSTTCSQLFIDAVLRWIHPAINAGAYSFVSPLALPFGLEVGITVPADFPSIRLHFTQIHCFKPPCHGHDIPHF